MRMLYAADMGGVVDTDEMPVDDDAQIGPLSEEDRSYVTSIYDGFLSKSDTIDQQIESMSNGWKITRMGRVDRAILRLAIYELLFCKGVPKPVVIDEAVRLAKKYGAEKSGAFINGVLGGVFRAHTDKSEK